MQQQGCKSKLSSGMGTVLFSSCFSVKNLFSFSLFKISLQGGKISLEQKQLLCFSLSFAEDGYKPPKTCQTEHYLINMFSN